ncbi:ABC transporter permease [Actinocrispum sp. NPDC049592]|uniref:ABC transporter permease n=1 Tax=Actinocrispum sp. NPDC049592 TaxID=3154835 RepID=UPI003432E899
MDRLIRAEFRKIFTTNLWWALLIPAAVLSLVFTWGGAALGTLGDVTRAARGQNIPLALPFFAQGINFATVFALILGGTAVTGEMRHKTITTTYLTSPKRGDVLAAKLAVYSSIGVLYGLVCMVAATLGALFGSNFPEAADWFTLAGVGVLAMVLWTLLGVGLGALIGNQVGTIVGSVVYVLVVEPIVSVVLRTNDLGDIPPYLLNKSGGDMVSQIALDLSFRGLQLGSNFRGAQGFFEELLGLTYSPEWWGSLLVFAAWAGAFGLAGYLVAKRRDIT